MHRLISFNRTMRSQHLCVIRPCSLSPNFRYAIVATLLSITTFIAPSPVAAVENGVEASPIGLHAFSIMPPPTQNRFLDIRPFIYRSSTLMDSQGSPVPGPNSIDVEGVAFKYINTTDHGILSGRYYWGVAIPAVRARATATLPTPPGAPFPFVTLTGANLAVTSLVIDPVGIRWDLGSLHINSKFTIGFPTAGYQASRFANAGTNRLYFGPRVGFSYNLDGSWKVSGEVRLDINRRNSETRYKSGNELHLDWGLSRRIDGSNAHIGLGGYFYRQTTDDKSDGLRPVLGRARVNGIGPAFVYQKDGSFWIDINYASESGARNRFEGKRLWIRTGIPF